jgi:hypothetical protein
MKSRLLGGFFHETQPATSFSLTGSWPTGFKLTVAPANRISANHNGATLTSTR